MKTILPNQAVILTAAEAQLIRNLRIIDDDEETDALIGMTRDRIIAERASEKRPALRLVAEGVE